MAKKVGNTYFFTGKGKSSGGGGGGGDATDAIKYTEQPLTSPQKMQARKNQGLYYSEGGGGDVTLTWDGDTTGLERVEVNQGVIMYKVSDNSPQKELVKSLGMTVNGVEQIIDIPQQGITPIEGGYAMGEGFVIVVTESEGTVSGLTFTKGIWFVKGVSTGNYVSKFTYGATETIHHIEPKYIKDMYYEETTEGEKTVDSIADTSPTPAFSYDYIGFYKAASDTPVIADIKKVNNNTIGDGDLTAEDEGDYTIYTPNWATETQEKFIVVYESTTIGSDNVEPGLYYPSDVMFARPYLSSVTYIGDISTVHQIPAKYIPNTQTAPVIKMTVPSMGDTEFTNIGFIILNQYVTSREVEVSVDGETIQSMEVLNFTDPTAPVSDVSISDNIITISQGGIFVILVYLDDKECVGILFCDNYV